jgi:hypothetical protein
MKKHKIFIKYYTGLAIFFLNTFILFLLINIILSFYMGTPARTDNPVASKYGLDSLEKVYPQLSRKEINNLLIETWNRPFQYEPFTQFKEGAFVGKYVNVDENGFRITKGQGPWPPDQNYFNVFLFGGSTTFCYGLTDDQTIASYLYELFSKTLKKRVSVYNFGRGFYYSTQERLLYEKLLIAGFVPDMAIFIDGLNDFYNTRGNPQFTAKIKQCIKACPSKVTEGKVRRKVFGGDSSKNYIKRGAFIRFLLIKNKKMVEAISDVYAVKPVFVWQPIPTYKYDQKYHLFTGGAEAKHLFSKYGYPYMVKYSKKNPLGDTFLWCADINADAKETLYLDSVHYNDKMSKKFANGIFNLMLERNILDIGNQ